MLGSFTIEAAAPKAKAKSMSPLDIGSDTLSAEGTYPNHEITLFAFSSSHTAATMLDKSPADELPLRIAPSAAKLSMKKTAEEPPRM